MKNFLASDWKKSNEMVIQLFVQVTLDPTVHAFLYFMNESGADFVPIPYSCDAMNETLSFISGDVFNYPLPTAMLTDDMIVASNQAIAIIDFDTIHPGTKMWEISYVIYHWVPFVGSSLSESLPHLEEKIRKTRLFLDTYGVTTEERCECSCTSEAIRKFSLIYGGESKNW